jgi:DNA-binding NtrC family response regulator
MSDRKATLLIVAEEVGIGTSLSQIFTGLGHHVRSAANAQSAMSEIQREIPDILISDLNMPDMAGIEVLSVVRRQFPTIRVIAMSERFRGDEASSVVAADGFYQKGSSLLRIIEMKHWPERVFAKSPKTSEVSRSISSSAAAL